MQIIAFRNGTCHLVSQFGLCQCDMDFFFLKHALEMGVPRPLMVYTIGILQNALMPAPSLVSHQQFEG